MDGQGVAGQEHLHVAGADQAGEVRRAAGVDDDGPGHEGNLSAVGPDALHHLGHARDGSLDAPLRRHFVAHEREAVAVAILESGDDANALDAADDRVALPEVAQLAARGAGAVDHDGRVHALVRDGQPVARPAHVRFVVGRRIEVHGRAAVLIGGARHHVLPALDQTAQGDEVLDDLAKVLVARRGHPHRQDRRLGVGAADRELQHLEAGVVPDDGVEDAVEDAGVDQMTGGFDDFRCHACSLPLSYATAGEEPSNRTITRVRSSFCVASPANALTSASRPSSSA